jgi:hypothetical protein
VALPRPRPIREGRTPLPAGTGDPEKALSPEHPEVASSLNRLAHFYHDQEQYAKAEPLYLRALAIRKKVLNESAKKSGVKPLCALAPAFVVAT